MAGIYIHIPFCRKRCTYCNFYSQTDFSQRTEFVDALCEEISKEKDFLANQNPTTIYFGGGTPSILNAVELEKIFNTLEANFDVSHVSERTIEINPDDATEENLKLWRKYFNRLSIGIQSFKDNDLTWMNRRHTAEQALDVIAKAKTCGFDKISIDLIYGLPTLSNQEWEKTIQQAIALPVEHISAYALTVEPETALFKLIKEKKIANTDDERTIEQFDILISDLETAGFEQYEISNFAKNGAYAKHNSAYWSSKIYLGLGPGAHSYNGSLRRFNISNLALYIDNINNKKIIYEEEVLSIYDKYNEYILTALRTNKGISVEYIREKFGTRFENGFLEEIKKLEHEKLVCLNSNYTLTKKGKHIADNITATLFILD